MLFRIMNINISIQNIKIQFIVSIKYMKMFYKHIVNDNEKNFLGK